MALFQNSVLNKYLNELDNSKIATLYAQYSEYFLNPDIQQNIRESKEEQFQEGFLRELFVKVLGYTINPNPNYNLTTELKNESGAKKADGAIMKGGKAIGVIELKSTTTKDLESIRQQAFDYKANHSECIYVVTSNFEKLRFYIDNAVDYEEFDLFTLTLSQFKLLYLCLNVDNILGGVPKSAKIASLVKEENVTKKLYADYSVFKEKLFKDIITRKENLDLAGTTDEKEAKLILFKKTQKLMDRFLFIFFSEDRGLIPPNTISTILTEWEKLKSLDAYRPLYDRFKRHFDYINEGWKGDNYEVFAYNGGLFLPDPILDNITIDDEVLYEHTKVLTKYDFESEVDVNILGHIFEHSLTEIETVSAELEGQEIDKKKTKRKKDGVFYTPKYITKYIVDNTVGKLCEEKKQELGIEEEDYLKGKKNRRKETIKKLEDMLITYRDWLLGVTIVDPACGSGAFLNQALEFLIAEHRWIDEMTAKLFGGGLVFQDVENSILENNLYGVDINEESVEIAKLSLWLRTAQKGRKLTSLNNNIKCGNSLIDDPAVAGDKAFKWEEEFPKVFAKGGFDVVIGNPPYVSNRDMHKHGLQDHIKYWNRNYEGAKTGNYDIFILFIEKGLRIVRKKRYLSFIIPNKFLSAKYSRSILSLINKKFTFKEIIDYSNINVFLDASIYPIIITLYKAQNKTNTVSRKIVEQGAFEEFGINRLWDFINLKFVDSIDNESKSIIDKIENSKNILNDELDFEPGINGFQFTNYAKCVTDGRINKDSKRLIVTGSIDPHIFTSKITRYKKKDYIEPFITYDPNIISEGKWSLFCKPKVMIAGMTKSIEASLDIEGNYAPAVSVYSICGDLNNLYQIQLVISSKLVNWFFRYKFSDKHMSGGYISVNNLLLQKIPFRVLKEIDATKKLVLNANLVRVELENLVDSLSRLLQSKFDIDKLSKKLQNWHELDFKQFLAELKKKKVKLSLNEEAEWMDYFNEKKAEAQELKAKIDATDNEIDYLVYKLYDLTYDEVLIVDPETPITREGY